MNIWPFSARTKQADKRLVPNQASGIVISRPQTMLQYLYWLASVPDPDTLLQRVGITRAQLRVLETDDEISQALDTRRDALMTTPWRIEPFNTRSSRFLIDELKPYIQTLLSSAFNAVPYGYSVIQVNYKIRDDGKIGIAHVWETPFEWFTPTFLGDLRARQILFVKDEQGNVRMAATVNDSVLEKSPGMYFHTVRMGSYRNPYGEALLSRLWFPVTWRLAGWQLWMNFLETFGQPIIVGQTINYEAFVDAMRAQGVRSAIGFQAADQDTKITTIQASQAGEFAQLDTAVRERIQELILGQTATTSLRGSGGSYAAAQVHNEIRHDKRNADIRMVTKTLQKLVDTLVELNRLNGNFEFILSDDTGLELERAQRDAAMVPVLAASGITLTREYYLDKYDYDDGDLTKPASTQVPSESTAPGTDDLEQPTEPQPAGPPMEVKTPSQQFAALPSDTKPATLQSPLPLSEIKTAIQQATSQTDLEHRLGTLLGTGGEQFRRKAGMSTFAANVLGYVDAYEGKK